MADPSTKPGLWAKLTAVMAAVDYVPKTGRNTHHNYDYATEADITARLRKALVENKVAFVVSVMDWKREQDRTQVQMGFRLVDAETGEAHEAQFWGEGQDKQDKGFYKAYTGAVKYFLLKTFLIPTGDDPEADEDSGKHRQQPPQRSAQETAERQTTTLPAVKVAALKIAAAKLWPNLEGEPLKAELLKGLRKRYNVTTVEALTMEQADEAIKTLEAKAAEQAQKQAAAGGN